MRVGIVQYPGSNARSVVNAFSRQNVTTFCSSAPEELETASHLVFPGQGEATTAMSYLKDQGLDLLITGWKRPFLGICLGMQLLFDHSEEGETPLLGILSGTVRRLLPTKPVPHTGWSRVMKGASEPVFRDIRDGTYFYFLHSYAVKSSAQEVSLCQYEEECFSAAVRFENFLGVQFHPEKSGAIGQTVLRNFVEG